MTIQVRLRLNIHFVLDTHQLNIKNACSHLQTKMTYLAHGYWVQALNLQV